MKKPKVLILILTLVFSSYFSKAQSGTVINNSTVDGSCSCLIDIDSTFILALTDNDDLTTSVISLPFPFCFYGQNIDSVYINNNGNISMVTPYGTFSSFPFPFPGNNMIAPFWSDVDTRDTLGGIGVNGNVYYKLTPTAFIVRWEKVGYYIKQGDKLNDFQLILTNSIDTLIPGGNNLEFCYGDMQWTTGSASGGVNGFGGSAATVGINKGDAVEYMQVGRFDQPGIVYDGGYGANDGVDWLDNKTVILNTCVTTSVPSVVLDEFCDTVSISSSLSSQEIENSSGLKIYPNPANNFIDVEIDFENCNLSVYDITGKLILKQNINKDKTRIDISDFENGLYYILLQTAEKKISKKIIKQ